MKRTTQSVSYMFVAQLFLRIGAVAFGGWSTTVLLLEQKLVEANYITRAELNGAVAYAQIIPGATQIQIVSNVGYRLKRTKGAILATICYISPALLLFLAFSIFYFHFLHNSHISNHLLGVSAALSGVLFANAYRVSKLHVTHPFMWLLVVLAAVLTLRFGLSTVVVVLLFGVAGLGLSFWKARRRSI